MEILLLTILGGVCKYCLCTETEARSFESDVLDFVAANEKLFVLTDTKLHQMRLNLSLETLKETSNAPTSSRVVTFLPFIANGTLIICGVRDCGYCEVLDINNISQTIHGESIGIGSYPNIARIIDHGRDKYLLVGKNIRKSECDSDALVTLRDTKDGQSSGGIFSVTDIQSMASASIQNIVDNEVEFVDGFQSTASSHVYLLLNERRGSDSKVKVLSLENKQCKGDTFKTLQGAVLQCYEGDKSWMLLSSAVIHGETPVLWAGVFQDKANIADTVVAVFDISRSRTAPVSGFCINKIDACSSRDVEEVRTEICAM